MLVFRPVIIAGVSLTLFAVTAEAQQITAAVETPPPAVAPPEKQGNPATVFSWDELPFVNTDVGRRASLMDEASRTLRTLEVHITTLNPGEQSHPPHRHVNEEVVVLREGVLDVYVNGEIKRVGPGSVMVFLSNDWHSVNNVGDTPATYHVINFYPKNP